MAAQKNELVSCIPIQQIAVPLYERREKPSPHIVYAVQVTLPDRTWTIRRRYNDFCLLHERLPSPAPPAPLPPKHRLKQTWRMLTQMGGILPTSDAQKLDDDKDLELRREALEKYLRAIVVSPDAHWRESHAFIEFLDVQDHMQLHEQSQAISASAEMPRIMSSGMCAAPLRPWNQHSTSHENARARETDATRPLTDAELLQYQTDDLMRAQDKQADALAIVLRRQRELGLRIHDELGMHREMLDSLHTDVQSTQTRMDAAEAEMKRLNS